MLPDNSGIGVLVVAMIVGACIFAIVLLSSRLFGMTGFCEKCNQTVDLQEPWHGEYETGTHIYMCRVCGHLGKESVGKE